MRLDCPYDVVVEVDYPLGHSSELAFDTWGRDLSEKVHARFDETTATRGVRAVRTENHLKISLQVQSFAVLGPIMSALLAVVAPQSPEDIVMKIHEAAEVIPEPMAIQEML